MIDYSRGSIDSGSEGPPISSPSSTGSRGRGADGEQTRQRLIEAAERVFAESGLESVSLRRIAAAAGVNSAAVHYHFGSRDALIEGVLMRRVEDIQRRREALLAEPPLAGAAELRRIVEVLARPWAELVMREGEAGRAYLKLCAKLYSLDRAFITDLVTGRFGESYREIGDRAEHACAGVPRAILNRRLVLVLQTALTTLGDADLFSVSGDALPSDEQAIAELIDFLTAGLAGAVSNAGAHAAPEAAPRTL